MKDHNNAEEQWEILEEITCNMTEEEREDWLKAWVSEL